MTKIILRFLCLTLAQYTVLHLATNTQSLATGWAIEPSVGYRSETIKLTDLTQQTSEMKGSAPVLGLKLGLRSALGVELNVGYEHFVGKAVVTNQSDKVSFTHQTASAQLGVNALGLMKIYLGYAFLNENKAEATNTMPAFTVSGPAYIAGLQFKLLPFTYLGFQYNLNQYSKIKGDAFTASDSLDTYYSKTVTQDYSIYLSVSL